MSDLDQAKSTIGSLWSKAWVWVADHPKTTIVIAAVVIVIALVI